MANIIPRNLTVASSISRVKGGLLDTGVTSGAAAAYSLRRLSKSYNGKSVRIRRDSDNSETDIGFTKSGDLDTATIETFARKNFLRYSDEIDNPVWTKSASGTGVVPVVTADFEGIADRVQLDSGAAGASNIVQTVANINTTIPNAVLSVYLKLNTGTSESLTLFFNSAVIQITVTNEWQRFEFATTNLVAGQEIRLSKRDTWGTAGSIDMLVKNVQVEVGSTATEYQATTTDTRADLLVTTWYDQSGSGNNATQTTAGNQPKIYDAATGQVTTNGKPSVYFDGTDKYLDTGYKTSNMIATAFAVVQHDVGETMSWGSYSVNDRMYFGYSLTNGIGVGYGSDSWSVANTGVKTTDQILQYGLFDGTSATTEVNSANSDTGTPTTLLSSADNFYIGGANSGGSNTFDMDGTIQEIVIYNSDESSNRLKVEDNINGYYGVY